MYLITAQDMIKELQKLPPDQYISGVGINNSNSCNMLVICGIGSESILEIPMKSVDDNKLRGLRR